MRRVWLIGALIAIAGCNARDLFTAHADVAAEAAGQHLTAARLAAIMGQTKGIRVTREAADFVANIWVDYTLFAQAVAHRTNLGDSLIVADMMWPQIAMVKGDRWFDTVLSRRIKLSPKAADSLYNAGELRLIQHILYTVPATAEPPLRAETLRKAQAALARLRSGADFGAIALSESQDPQSARDSGFLPPSPKGAFVTSFDSAAWSLPPGGLSGIVETPYGYHILKRPTADAVRERLTSFLESNVSGALDSVYRDSLAAIKKLQLTGSAPAIMRAALADPEHQRTSTKSIATYHGGSLTVADFLRWVYALPPQFISQLKTASDEQLKQIAKIFTQNILLLQQADSARISLTPVEWAGLVEAHRAEIDTLRAALGLGSDLTDTSVAVEERTKLAALRLDTYFDNLVTWKSSVQKIPATLSAWLRAHAKYHVNEAGLIRAVDLAEAANQRADSAAAADSARQRNRRPGDSGGTRPAPSAPPSGGH
jgi:hypothetical protein